MSEEEIDKKWLDSIDINDIPVLPDRTETIFDIMDITERENSWSSLYAFFLDENKYGDKHKLKDLFIRKLEAVCDIEEKWITDYNVQLEVVTKKDGGGKDDDNKRIDILITSKNSKRAIIIENKVKHIPINPFDTYINYVREQGYSDIYIIIISLHKITDADIRYYGIDKKFKNANCDISKLKRITHLDFIKEIEKEWSESQQKETNAFYSQILEDFITNIKNVTMDIRRIESFYNQDIEKMTRVYQFYKSVVKDYNKSLKDIKIDKLTPKTNNDDWTYLAYEKKEDVCLTLFFLDRNWEKYNEGKPYFTIILELKNSAKNSVANKESSADFKEMLTKYEGKVNIKKDLKWKECGHYASVDIPVEKETLFPDKFREFLENEIPKNPLYQLGLDIIRFLK